MQNDECKMQNEGISFGNDSNLSATRTPQFCIFHFAFCISVPPSLQETDHHKTYTCPLDFERSPHLWVNILEPTASGEKPTAI